MAQIHRSSFGFHNIAGLDQDGKFHYQNAKSLCAAKKKLNAYFDTDNTRVGPSNSRSREPFRGGRYVVLKKKKKYYLINRRNRRTVRV